VSVTAPVVPGSLVPGSVAPGPVVPGPVVPGPVVPGPVVPGPVVEDSVVELVPVASEDDELPLVSSLLLLAPLEPVEVDPLPSEDEASSLLELLPETSVVLSSCPTEDASNESVVLATVSAAELEASRSDSISSGAHADPSTTTNADPRAVIMSWGDGRARPVPCRSRASRRIATNGVSSRQPLPTMVQWAALATARPDRDQPSQLYAPLQ
jgi:hypothetical protein